MLVNESDHATVSRLGTMLDSETVILMDCVLGVGSAPVRVSQRVLLWAPVSAFA